ncbi:DNA polymerase IV [Agreia sp. COWG]|uniref:DNA polymerase IV n=1 Tax=Agreia sp. COWG TaxID=2773266 RepID=UPI0019295AC8|nr:DNA polymerase IV [Agreia sp. COWG]CAD5995898.1 DNA polymerase IV [Agreia sp. COWG]
MTQGAVSGVDESSATMLHIDMDAFFASVELLDHPELRGQPVIIGHAGGRGVVTSATYEARRLGVHSAMPVSVAMRLAPKAHILPPHMKLYQHYSAEVMRIFRDVTPLVEPLSIDEAFLDVSGARRLLGAPRTIAELVRARVLAETGLTCSVGASSTKFIAKMASQRAKPDGVLVVPQSEILNFLHPLPIGALWGVGASTEASLARLGIKTVKELAETPIATLTRAVGEASGHKLQALASGIDPRGIVLERQEKSVGHEVTFEFDVGDRRVLHRELLKQANQVAVRLRKAGLEGRTVALKLRFSDFTTITRSRTLSEPTDLGKLIYDEAKAILDALDLRDDQRVRLIGVRAEQLVEAGSVTQQPSLWIEESEAQADGWRDAERTIDKLAARFGSGAVGPASLLNRKKGE